MKEIFAKVLPADMPRHEYEVYKKEVERKNKALIEDAKNFVLPKQQIIHGCMLLRDVILMFHFGWKSTAIPKIQWLPLDAVSL